MIETQFFILSQEQYDQCVLESARIGVSIDYFLMEFCTVEGD